MSLTIHELTHSPFCIPVRRILGAHGIPFDRIEVPTWDRRALSVLTEGKYYQVPIIEHDGNMVFETASDPLAVAHYLDQALTKGSLFPDHCSGLQEIVIAHIEDTLEGIGFRLSDPGFIDSITDPGERGMVIRHKERKLGIGCVEQWRANAAAIAEEFQAVLTPYETRLGHTPYLFSDEPVYADFALLGVLGNAQYGDHFNLSSRFKNIKRWESGITNYERG